MKTLIYLLAFLLIGTSSFARTCNLALTENVNVNIAFHSNDPLSMDFYNLSVSERVDGSWQPAKLLGNDEFTLIATSENSEVTFSECERWLDGTKNNEPMNKSLYTSNYQQRVSLISSVGAEINGVMNCSVTETREIDDASCEDAVIGWGR